LGGEIPEDYGFEEWDEASGGARPVRLSELFGERDALFLYSFMWVPASQELGFTGPCPSCTSIIDAVDGQVQHVTQRLSFAVAANAPVADLRAHAASRDWRHTRLLSASPSNYSRAYGAEDARGGQWPLATVFVRRDSRIYHFWSSELWRAEHPQDEGPRHVDFMWPMWGILDRIPEGRGDFQPALSY
jgi:predicted dithiol-disulfide oxidoreductase (DUF899 family)